MHDDSHGNALTEVALALAMGFFAIMVLAMVSMGAAPPAVERVRAGDAGTGTTRDALVVIYHRGGFFDQSLAPMDMEQVRGAPHVVLAVDPAVPMREALDARARLDIGGSEIAVLDAEWSAALHRVERRGGKNPQAPAMASPVLNATSP